MKIKLLTSISGPEYNYTAGQEVDMRSADAERLIERGMALLVREAPRETATNKDVREKASRAIEQDGDGEPVKVKRAKAGK